MYSYSSRSKSSRFSSFGGKRRGFGSKSTYGSGDQQRQYGYGGTKSSRRVKGWPVSELERIVRTTQEETAVSAEEMVYLPKHSFTDFEVSTLLKANILSKGYKDPTPIQDKVIPAIINGKDVIGIANTGTGKTAAFLIPLIELANRNKSRKTLILTPTRELAMQIYNEFRDFSQDMHIFTAVLIGGASVERQKLELRKQPSFVIATPGRLKDLIKQRAIRLSDFSAVVLDETDCMVDIGFINDIKYFISLFPKNRQSLFFSATVPPKVEEILLSFVRDPVKVSVKKQDTAKNVSQRIVRLTTGERKLDALNKILIDQECQKALVFGTTKWGVQKLSDMLVTMGHRAGAIHGNKSQSQRNLVLKQFKKNEIKVLLATDVASRGLDIEDITHVINYDMPETYDDYIHRIGRTGRAGKKGIAMTLV